MNTYVVNRYNVPTPGATSQLLSFTDATVRQFTAFDKNTKVLFISVTNGGVYMTIDGSTPTTNNNHKLYGGSNYYFNSDLMSQAKFLRDPNNANSARIYASELTN
tara:strand:+ start:1011 stop:1325 length:315 start_codon:yes stop_codon:yes gene_type:complete